MWEFHKFIPGGEGAVTRMVALAQTSDNVGYGSYYRRGTCSLERGEKHHQT